MRVLGRVGRGLLWVALLVLVLVLAAVVWLKVTSTPRVSGTVTLPGLSGPVTVTRDQWGVPHIRAQTSDEDAMYALGFVHAQDRAWQMDFQRRVSQGRLAEVLGAAALPQDRFLRTWGFYRAAESALPALSEPSRRMVRAYTAGVNAGFAQGKLAPEFRILGYAPEPWTDVDSIAWSKLMAYDLGGNADDEILGTHVVKRLGEPGLNEVLPPYPQNAPTILSREELGLTGQAPRQGSEAAILPDATLRALQAHLDAARALGMERVPGKGSNDWVIGGSRTASGKPILADDPHLALSSPMLWYLADVQGPRLKAIGATIPGLPGIVIGRNDRVAWGVTNVNPDVQDLYIEPENAKLTERTEIIKVKGQPDVRLTVRESAHGPIISDVGAGEVGPRVALKWTALQPGDTTLDAFLGLNYARNWQDFVTALEKYVAPSQNFVYADVDGKTGYYAPGRVPIRQGWDGSLPVPGDGRHEWTGYIPFARLPHTSNPADGLVVTANNKVVPEGYPYNLANIRNWSEPYRAERITELLTQKPRGLTVDDVKRVQLDTVSLVWRDLKPFLLATQPDGDLSRRALELLRGWDGNERAGSVEPTIFEAWLLELQTMAQDELGDETRVNSLAVLNQLRANGELCRDERDEAAGRQDCAGELQASLKRAVDRLAARLGPDPGGWTYGKVHTVASNHRAFGGVKALAWLFNHSAPTNGGTNTVNVARPDPDTMQQTTGPSYRQIIDLSDLNRSVYVGTLGQSGSPFGNHVSDQQKLWAAGEYLPMSTDTKDWGKTNTLTLRP
ncbi:penicillin acylase family protein [Deinococcus metallilatus]|uniref:Penicillin acylase family protein n=1 Tax=Deinococcus metallilatus TaxID=1211322 RepID=A0AAJ5F3H0_9DEIO|nr:penicillin acylase family protein [Deinococcus metallilatus]MBB5296340.1 penicillin amidase [Deinococcus metallilatus]QBY09981.1 penicillin acylase family protein [Deinococcus metallilatus]RXJ08705.1 penicillin acylase family protein [Deinococcus metallilatus]TLK25179.1 penicillin acylase family protein [Deinococcus metallilatus]GMA14747.1 penicillin acylase [Deinococcus metallilatus]